MAQVGVGAGKRRRAARRAGRARHLHDRLAELAQQVLAAAAPLQAPDAVQAREQLHHLQAIHGANLRGAACHRERRRLAAH